MSEIEELLSPFDYRDFSELRYNVPKNAMNTKIGRYFVKDIAKEILYMKIDFWNQSKNTQAQVSALQM